MYKAREEEINSVLNMCAEQVTQMIQEYKYINKLDVCVPLVDVYPIADQGFVALLKHEDDVMGSIVVIDDEAIFTSYGKDEDLLH